jgi:exosortase E/protease (VPEID-CTERM system)
MSQNAALETRAQIARSLVWRWIGLILLLGVELLAVTDRLDTATLAERPGLLAAALGYAPALLNVALAFLGALLLLVGVRLPERIRDLAAGSERHSWAPWVLLHFASLGGFFVLSLAIFDETKRGVALGIASAAGWLLLALGAFLLWLLAIAPWPAWRTVIAKERRALAISAAIALAAWAAGQATQLLWKPMADATFQLARAALAPLYPNIIADAAKRVLGTDAFHVEIAPACSGYEGIGLVVVFVGAYLWLFRARLRFPAALILIPAGAAIIWLFNALRIAALIVVGSSWSADIAAGGFHSQAGWLGFIAVALSVVAVTHRVRLFATDIGPAHCVPSQQEALVAALLMPFVVMMGATMLVAASSAGFPSLYPLKILATAAALWVFRRAYRRLSWGWSWHSVAIGVAVFALWILLEPSTGAPSPIASALAALPVWLAAAWLAFRALGSAIIVPLAEELAFRGYLLPKLVAQRFEDVDLRRMTPFALIASSLLFGLLHGRWLAGTLAGMAYAYAISRNGRIGDAVVAHATTNAFIAVDVLVFGHWGLWAG